MEKNKTELLKQFLTLYEANDGLLKLSTKNVDEHTIDLLKEIDLIQIEIDVLMVPKNEALENGNTIKYLETSRRIHSLIEKRDHIMRAIAYELRDNTIKLDIGALLIVIVLSLFIYGVVVCP